MVVPHKEVGYAFLMAVRTASPGSRLTQITMCVLDDHNARNAVPRVRDVLIANGAEDQAMLAAPPARVLHPPGGGGGLFAGFFSDKLGDKKKRVQSAMEPCNTQIQHLQLP